jgi:hypothetical protein
MSCFSGAPRGNRALPFAPWQDPARPAQSYAHSGRSRFVKYDSSAVLSVDMPEKGKPIKTEKQKIETHHETKLSDLKP